MTILLLTLIYIDLDHRHDQLWKVRRDGMWLIWWPLLCDCEVTRRGVFASDFSAELNHDVLEFGWAQGGRTKSIY